MIAIIYVLGYSIVISTKGALYNTNEIKNVQTVSGVNFIIVGCLFMLSGVLINIRLKTYFKEFYDENFRTLWLATVMLSIPLIFRGTIDILRCIDKELEEFIQMNSMWYSPVFWILTDLIPLCF